MKMVKRLLQYLAGCLIIAVGINISKLARLGISPVSSIPRALEVSFGFTLGTMVIVVYCLLVLAQFIVLRKQFKPINILGVAVGIVFGWMVDLVGIDPNAFGHLMAWVPAPSNYFMSVVYLLASIVIIGTGVAIYLKPQLVPMPAEGLAQAISIKTGKTFGDCKTIVDCCIIAIALLIQIIFLGWSSFTGDTVVVREGTIVSALLVGQVVKLVNKLFTKKTVKVAAAAEEKAVEMAEAAEEKTEETVEKE